VKVLESKQSQRKIGIRRRQAVRESSWQCDGDDGWNFFWKDTDMNNLLRASLGMVWRREGYAYMKISAESRKDLQYLKKKRKEEVGGLGGCLNLRNLREGMRLLIVERRLINFLVIVEKKKENERRKK
jgi:hypothetical protein